MLQELRSLPIFVQVALLSSLPPRLKKTSSLSNCSKIFYRKYERAHKRESIMSAVNRALSKSLRLQKTYSTSAPRQAARSVSLFSSAGGISRASGFRAAARGLSRTTTTTSRFHTMASLQSAAAAPAKPAEGVGYDPEIKDIANYIHNYSIDSDLAVSSAAAAVARWDSRLPRNRG